jgi:hypothetical protein
VTKYIDIYVNMVYYIIYFFKYKCANLLDYLYVPSMGVATFHRKRKKITDSPHRFLTVDGYIVYH